MKNLSIYFFSLSHSNYELPDPGCKHLSLSQKIVPIVDDCLKRLRNAEGNKLQQLVLSYAPPLLAGISSGVMIANRLAQPDDQEENSFSQIALGTIVASTTLFCGNKAMKVLRHFDKATSIFSQTSKFHLLLPFISKTFLELRQENKDLIDLWMQINDLANEEDTLKFIEMELKTGACAGYVMGILDQLKEGKELHGDTLLKNLNIKTVIKKQLFNNFYYSFNNFLEINKNEGTLQRSIIQKAANASLKMYYRTNGAFKINVAGPSIDISAGPRKIKEQFLHQLHDHPFQDFDQFQDIDPADSNGVRSLYDSFKMSFFRRREKFCPEQNHFYKDKKTQTNFSSFLQNDAIIAGEIIMERPDGSHHDLYFRLSNKKYHFFDPNEAFFELPTFAKFFDKVCQCIADDSGIDTKICFRILAIEPDESDRV